MEPKQVQPIQVEVDLGVMGMKEYATFSKAPGLEPHHQLQLSVIPRTSFLGWGKERGSLTSL